MPLFRTAPRRRVFQSSWERVLLLLLLLACLLLSGPRDLSAQETATTLQETLAAAQASLAAGDYPGAVSFFEAIQTTFGREPEVGERSFQIVITPLHAYAAQLSGDNETAIELYEDFIERFPDDRTRLAFVLFNLARAQQSVDKLDEAIATYRRFVAIGPDRPEAALATLAAAELMFQADRPDEAFEALDALCARLPDGLIRNKARLTALQKALDLDRTEAARNYMLGAPWEVAEMPELAVLAFAALEMGHALLEEAAYADAIACYRLVPPYNTLLEAQRQRLTQTRARFESRRQSVGLYQGGQFWTRFYTDLIGRLSQQLEALETAEDYSPALYLSFGQAYLLAGRAHEAWILFETLARDSELATGTRAEAHYRWILAAIEVGVWEDAFRIAKGFGERFPESPLVPDSLYLLATAYQKARQYRDAVGVLDRLLLDHPSHNLAPRARFVRGYNYSLLNEPQAARGDFEAFIHHYPKHGLYQDARFWRALTFFAERDYDAALKALQDLAPSVEGQRLEPEVAYRIASTLYAKKDYEAALTGILRYLDGYPLHARHEEARVLLGDIQMGRGELTEARSIFASISPRAEHLFVYAVFQIGKILRAVAGAEDREGSRKETLRAHREHFDNYLARDDLSARTRISEALYWIGWTYIEEGEKGKAREVFSAALSQYGDDIVAAEVPNIIDAFARTEKRLSGLGRPEREAALKEWIQSEKEQAIEEDRLTYYARLNLYLDAMYPPEDPTSLVFDNVENVPIERLGPESLGKMAAELVERYPLIAEDYLVRLEDDFPDSHHRSYGYYARAVLLMEEQRYEEASDELSRFRAESPRHPLSTEVALRVSNCLTKTERFDEAAKTLESILTLRQARGRPHARALLGLSRNAEAAGKLSRAIPYAQRVYNVYRAYPGLAAEAYWMSAGQFEAIGDPVAAYKTLDEMLSDERIRALPLAEKAAIKRATLLKTLPEGALEASNAASAANRVEDEQKEAAL